MTSLHIEDAKDELLRTPDVLADWISGQCMHHTVRPAFARMSESTPEDFKGWSVASLLTLAMHENQTHSVIAAAMWAIGNRFMADPGIKQAADVVFARMELEQAEDEAEARAADVGAFFNRIMDGQGVRA